MSMHRLPVVGIELILLFGLAACNLPAQPGQGTTPAVAAYTSAAETIIAQLTTIAGGFEGTEGPASSPISPDGAAATTLFTPTTTASDTPSPTPTPTAPDTPTLTPSPTVTAAPDDPRAALGDPTWQDNFRNGNDWALYEDDFVRFEVDDRLLEMTAFEATGRDGWMLAWPEPENLYLEIVVETGDCQALDRYGVIFRSDASEGYLLGFSCDGRYSLRIWDGEAFSALVDWTASAEIQAGTNQQNRLGVWIEDDTFTIYANGHELDTVSDDSYLEGGFGVFIGAKETDEFTVTVSEAAYWELP